MFAKTLSATETKNRFGGVLREISKTGGPIVVERDGQPVAVILSIEEYERSHRDSTLLPDHDALLEGAFGMWAGRSDIDDDWLEKGRERWEGEWPSE